MSDDLRLKIIGCEIDADLVKPEVWFYNQRVYERAIERMNNIIHDAAEAVIVDAGRLARNRG